MISIYRNWSFCYITLLLTIHLGSITNVHARGPVCYSCTNIPKPRDCDRLEQCGENEFCSTEYIVTASGNTFFNVGCASASTCSTSGRKRSYIYGEDIAKQHALERREDIPICLECCKNHDYCNDNLCKDVIGANPVNQTRCLECASVIRPDDCEYTVLCDVNQICYTEFLNLNGQERYRLGCIEPNACRQETLPSLVGRKRRRFLVDEIQLTQYCSKCCVDDFGNCNRELCRADNSVPAGVQVSNLFNPPQRTDLCRDLKQLSCKFFGLGDQSFCLSPSISNYACREYCGTCVNPGHATPSPTQAGGFLLPDTDCFYASPQYAGSYRTSVTGKTCLNWETVLSASGTNSAVEFPDGSAKAASNKCRDPYGRGQPWCFTSQTEWEFCPVPYCQECVFDGGSASYDGFLSDSVTNNTCDNWSQYTTGGPPIYDNSFPDGSISKAKNYCRDPFGLGNLYCYDQGKIQACTVPSCPGPCADNENTDCSIISTYVCGNDYLSKTLCPKTCGVCGFGLLPAKFVQPPEDICRDNEDANCGLLKDIICQDPTGALKYCAKTCNMCYLLYTTNPSLSSEITPATTLVTTPQPTVAMTTLITTTQPATDVTTVTPQSQPSTSLTTLTTPTQPATDVTTSASAPFWSPFGPFTCTITKGTCLMYSYRFCSTGNNLDCDGVGYKIQLCTRDLCPDMYSTAIPATTTVDPCQDDPKYTCNAPDLKDLLCKEATLAKQNCPKTCGICGPNCTDYLDCSSPSAIGLFCTDSSMSNMYCRKTCHQCDKPSVSVLINSCGDPVAHVSVCEKLHTELCICNDPDVSALCPNYCAGTCSSTPNLICTPPKR